MDPRPALAPPHSLRARPPPPRAQAQRELRDDLLAEVEGLKARYAEAAAARAGAASMTTAAAAAGGRGGAAAGTGGAGSLRVGLGGAARAGALGSL
jgi:hypothetical protein